MKNKTIITTLILNTLTIGTLAQANTDKKLLSTYLNVSKCVEIVSEPEQEGYWKGECASLAGIRIFDESGDAREWLSFQRTGDKEPTAVAGIGAGKSAFHYLTNKKIELRYYLQDEKIVPVGAIYRISGVDINNEKNPNKQTQTLLAVSFLGSEIEVVAQIDGTTSKANEAARKALSDLIK